MVPGPHLDLLGIPPHPTLQELTDFQVDKVPTGTPAGCAIYHGTDMPDSG